jgi:chemotaxis protein CheZ
MAHAMNDSVELQALFDSVASQRFEQPDVPTVAPLIRCDGDVHSVAECPAQQIRTKVGHLTRMLHDSLRELGYDRELERAASAIPDARDRLSYVATMTEQAAQRTLTATETAKPIQDQLATGAAELGEQWQRVLRREVDTAAFRDLVYATQGYLAGVPDSVSRTNAQLLEIMMAQDFQDLTGQVIKKITDIIQNLERQLLTLLVEHTPPERRSDGAVSLLNGPVVAPASGADVVTSQQQVDDLLESLGF